jgi:hypothetical protein
VASSTHSLLLNPAKCYRAAAAAADDGSSLNPSKQLYYKGIVHISTQLLNHGPAASRSNQIKPANAQNAHDGCCKLRGPDGHVLLQLYSSLFLPTIRRERWVAQILASAIITCTFMCVR